MNWIYDERTPHSRLMVGYDRYGITIRDWSDDCAESGFNFQEGYFTWAQYRTRDHSYSGDDGSGNLKKRLVSGAISLLGYWGVSSDNCGEVSSLNEYLNGLHVFNC